LPGLGLGAEPGQPDYEPFERFQEKICWGFEEWGRRGELSSNCMKTRETWKK